MKTIQLINQNIPFWAVIKGDFACDDNVKFLNPSLVKTPNFLDPRENALRKTYLRETKGRKWLHDYLDGQSFAIAELERKDVEEALTVWKDDVPLLEVAEQYKKAYKAKTGFTYKEVKKDEVGVRDVYRRRHVIPTVEGSDWFVSGDEEYDYLRTIWMRRRKDDKLQVVDGTHRSLATVWRYLLDKETMPKRWLVITFCQ